MSTIIQYTGFELKARGRQYSYRVVNGNAEPREFTLTISNRSFESKHFPYQDGAAFCYQKLQKALLEERDGSQVAGHLAISDEELAAYLEIHRPARKRTW
jgi:hypothetical protein